MTTTTNSKADVGDKTAVANLEQAAHHYEKAAHHFREAAAKESRGHDHAADHQILKRLCACRSSSRAYGSRGKEHDRYSGMRGGTRRGLTLVSGITDGTASRPGEPTGDDADDLEATDIDSDEDRDGDVDAEGASAIPSRDT